MAVEVAPRISDREIIEKLAGLEAGQKALRSEMKAGQEALRSEMNHRFKSLEDQYERIWNLILVVLAGIMGLIGFIVWDRKTATTLKIANLFLGEPLVLRQTYFQSVKPRRLNGN